MKIVHLFLLPIIAGVCVTACTPPTLPDDALTQASSSVDAIRETSNVLYRGVVQAAGVSIYMEGTHRLLLDDGRFILLESDAVVLDRYIGKRVEALGAIRPTMEPGSQVMRVQLVREQNVTSSALTSSSQTSADESVDLPASALATTSAVPIPAPMSAIQSSDTTVSPSSASSWQASDELTEKAMTMARANMAAENWTQEYCSTHWKFCIPIHKHWYFNSFGATATSLWHVEVGPLAIENLGEGPLVINLINGSVTADGEVRIEGDTVIGQRAWENGRHFEVRAPIVLEEAVRSVVQGLRVANEE